MRDIFTIALVWSTIRLATPLVLAALGGMFSERSGVINIALEGKMLAGAFAAAAVTYAADVKLGLGSTSQWVGLLAGAGAGLFLAIIYALVCIKYKADQVVTGAAINILMLGVPGLLSGALFLSSGSTPQLPKEHLLPQSAVVIGITILILVFISWYVLYRTPFGLRLRAVGEKPEAADAAGVSVSRIRYSGVLIAGVLAGLGGAYL
ncbi:MAG TPA: ABC transporter permease, partial [Pyrinomonadaceae bacterium]